MMVNKPDRCIAAADFVDHVKSLRTRDLKKVRTCLKSTSKMTHLYTIMITIDVTGKLLGPLFIAMQEITGYQFGHQVQQDLFVAPNILVTALNFGQNEEGIFEDVAGASVFSECWQSDCAGHRFLVRTLLDAAISEGREVQIVIVSPKTTRLCQPLDVYGFRMWKAFVRKI
ncbi:hypothetical protein BV898_16807 [Hypsibius exemplaris]|uniref:Uncharacterized protein n=1 Tax=Hypsibius exemplaris TaxID=2072580 RepID=A0A9X6NE74_HYPEX|nr:hypothetical protein BV898_16807 [Hypsibius exemplaris]